MITSGASLSDSQRTIDGPIVVGSGPVGLTFARTIASMGHPVLIIEAGEEIAAPGSSDLNVEMTGDLLPGALIGRTRQVGGGFNLWGGQLAALHGDETSGDGKDASRWPVDLSEIVSQYSTATEALGQKINVADVIVPSSALAHGTLEQSGLGVVATAWLSTPKMPRRVWNEISRSRMLTLAHGLCVDRIRHDANGRVVGVDAVSTNGSRQTFVGRAVVLACGTIETVRLLLLPTDLNSGSPWGRLPWLGRGFTDHLDAAVASIWPRDAKLLTDVFDPFFVNGVKYSPKTFASFNVDAGPDLHAVGMLTLPGNIRNSLSELRMLAQGLRPREFGARGGRLFRASASACRQALPIACRYLRHKRLTTIFNGGGTFRVSIEQPARQQSRIFLSSSSDRFGVPRPVLHWVKGREEGEIFLRKARLLKKWAEASGAAQVEIDPMLLSDPAAFAKASDDGLHHAGGARMASDPSQGVVDSNLAVFGTSGLYCCGAAVLPRMGYANPTLTAAALAVRLAKHISQEDAAVDRKQGSSD